MVSHCITLQRVTVISPTVQYLTSWYSTCPYTYGFASSRSVQCHTMLSRAVRCQSMAFRRSTPSCATLKHATRRETALHYTIRYEYVRSMLCDADIDSITRHCVILHYSALQDIAAHCSASQYLPAHCTTLHHTRRMESSHHNAVQRITTQRIALHYSTVH